MTEWTPQLLLFLGVGFLVANVRVGHRRAQVSAAPVVCGADLARAPAALLRSAARARRRARLLLAYDLIVLRRRHGVLARAVRFAPQMFGISMMFVYYGYLVPLSRRIGRGFYADGIWSETGFVPYWKIGAVSWREGEEIALVIVSRLRTCAPPGRARRALRGGPPAAS